MNPKSPLIPARRQVLLIVDDEPDFLSLLESLLTYNLPSIKILTAGSGSKGIVIARANVIDMIISDFHMAKMDGVEFLRQARIVQADIPMVIMSGDSESEFARRAFAGAGVKLVVAKPFDISRLVGLVHSLLDHGSAIPGAGFPVTSFDEAGNDALSRAWTEPAARHSSMAPAS